MQQSSTADAVDLTVRAAEAGRFRVPASTVRGGSGGLLEGQATRERVQAGSFFGDSVDPDARQCHDNHQAQRCQDRGELRQWAIAVDENTANRMTGHGT